MEAETDPRRKQEAEIASNQKITNPLISRDHDKDNSNELLKNRSQDMAFLDIENRKKETMEEQKKAAQDSLKNLLLLVNGDLKEQPSKKKDESDFRKKLDAIGEEIIDNQKSRISSIHGEEEEGDVAFSSAD